jgi:hypothetical protein
MEVMLAPELDDKAAARRSLDLTYLDDIPEERALERALSGKSSEEKEITRLDSGLGGGTRRAAGRHLFPAKEDFHRTLQWLRTPKKQAECAVIYPTIRTQ